MIREAINLDRALNALRLLREAKLELVEALPTHELRPYFRELDAICGSLSNRIRLEKSNGPKEAEKGTTGSQAGGDVTPGSSPPSDPEVQ